MDNTKPDYEDDLRLIEAGFPCHQVGAETQRERGASSALPPLYYLHVWWARRPLTPSRAAILASLLPADTDPAWFLRQLGIVKKVVEINGQTWTLVGKILDKIEKIDDGNERLTIDNRVMVLLDKENQRRSQNLVIIGKVKSSDPTLLNHPVLLRWENECQPIPKPWPNEGDELEVENLAANPAWAKERIAFENANKLRTPESKYGYDRAYSISPNSNKNTNITILDPTAGGGSIPFEALRLGHKVIANELNPVASVILRATLDYPGKYGPELTKEIKRWGLCLRQSMVDKIEVFFPASKIDGEELSVIKRYLFNCPDLLHSYLEEILDGFLYCHQVTCPNCGGDAPLLNTCWLCKETGKQWGIKIIADGKPMNGKVLFETYRVAKGRGPKGEDPNLATVNRGVGACIHCRQAIAADEIKAQARDESPCGKWQDRLYCVVAVRFQPKLDIDGQPLRYKSGERAGEIKTEKIRFFRPPNDLDLSALEEAKKRLEENWERWDAAGLIPTEDIPPKSNYNRGHRMYGDYKWCHMFTPRQLLGHITLIEELNGLKPLIVAEHGEHKGRAIITYLQFAIDKGIDYNSNQTRWEFTRGIVKGTFSRHNFAVQWIFGEMIFTGPKSGARWALSQVLDAYKGIAGLSQPRNGAIPRSSLQILNRTAAHLPEINDDSVDLICMDPPYYDNVLYAELSDFFFVWQKRTLKDQYPHLFKRRLTDKVEEAVANRARDGSSQEAKCQYQKRMGEIFAESRRVLKPDGIMTLMFNHKTQEAWETLTRSLIENGWIITGSYPVDSESEHGIHHMGKAAAVSSIFLSCRKRAENRMSQTAVWTDFGDMGVQQRIRKTVVSGLETFRSLKLNPVDEMVASYGRALRVLSEQWPVLDGDEAVGPIRAMNEASRVVAENQIRRLTGGRLKVEDLQPETAMALTLYGIYGLGELSYDEALNLSRSLNIRLETKNGGYVADGRFIGINAQTGSGRRVAGARAEDLGVAAPLIRKGSKLRLARPEERSSRRLENPQTEWDLLQGLVMAYRDGDIPVARGYLARQAGIKADLIKDLLEVWAAEMADETLGKEARALLFGLKT